jgi:hypothetical protein
MAVYQAAVMLNLPTLSRAGSLLQWFGVETERINDFPFTRRLTTAAPCNERPHLASSVKVNFRRLRAPFFVPQISDQSCRIR